MLFELARSVNEGPKNLNWSRAKTLLENYNIHASETAWIGTEFDFVVDNNADGLDSLYAQVKNLVLNLQASKEDPLS